MMMLSRNYKLLGIGQIKKMKNILLILAIFISATASSQNRRHNGVNPNTTYTLNTVSGPSNFYQLGRVRNDTTLDVKAIKVTWNTTAITPTTTDSTIHFEFPFGSGTYTPTLTNTTNVAASTAYLCSWFKVGDMVTVFGKVAIDPTAAAATVLAMSVPVTSGMTGGDADAGGTGASSNITGEVIAIVSDGGADVVRFKFVATDITNRTVYFQFSYKITAP